ncbi:hypothetical protein LBMAG55_19490 [Verrucomicrobiota bacterium]|nr:hypothetical protein LBMAG55_19490 [Verrucomicrobiota bacterium]
MQLCRDAVPTLPSDPDEDFAAVEPPAEGPEDGEDEEALGEGAIGALEEAVAELGGPTGSGRTLTMPEPKT